MIKKIPSYLWSIIALILGILLGGIFTEQLSFAGKLTSMLIDLIIMFVPFLILIALSPAIASLMKKGSAGKFALSVILWFVGTSALAGLFGLTVSSLIFDIPFSSNIEGASQEVLKMLAKLLENNSASIPLLAIIVSIVLGIIGSFLEPLYKILSWFEKGMSKAGKKVGVYIIPLILLFGINIGGNFGAKEGISHYIIITLYTFALCIVWLLLYLTIVTRFFSKHSLSEILKEYYIPTAVFAAGTCSSLATLPINLTSIKKLGVKDEIADFIIPFGAVINLNASTLVYIAYAPFVLTYLLNIPVSWTLLILLWPAVVLFTIASPGLPAGMGTALWSGTLLASMLNLEDPLRTEFLTMWIALSGGLPDMARTSTNCTIDGFTSIIFDNYSNNFFNKNTHLK